MTPLLAAGFLLAGSMLLFGLLASLHAMQARVARRLVLVEDVHRLHASGWTSLMDATAEHMRAWLAAGIRYRWAMRAPASVLLSAMITAGVATWLLLHELAGLAFWPGLTCSLVAAFGAARALLKRQQARAERAFLDMLPDAIDMVVRMLRAGVPVAATMRSLGDEATEPIDAVFHHLADRLDLGMPFGEAMQATGERIGLADFRAFAMAVALHSATGGNLIATLDVLSGIVRRRRETRLKARSVTAEVRVTAGILGVLPFLIAAILFAASPHYMAPLAQDPRGHVIVSAASIMLILGVASLRRMMRRATSVWRH